MDVPTMGWRLPEIVLLPGGWNGRMGSWVPGQDLFTVNRCNTGSVTITWITTTVVCTPPLLFRYACAFLHVKFVHVLLCTVYMGETPMGECQVKVDAWFLCQKMARKRWGTRSCHVVCRIEVLSALEFGVCFLVVVTVPLAGGVV